jgi:4-hydroxybenzoate polyprenyltransferase
LGERTRPWLFASYGLALALWAAAGIAGQLRIGYFILLGYAGVQLYRQAARVDTEDPADCLNKFRSNRNIGWAIFAGIIIGRLT